MSVPSAKRNRQSAVRRLRSVVPGFVIPDRATRLKHQPTYSFAKADAFRTALLTSSGLVSGRYHGVAHALALKVPFVALSSNTPKIEYMCQDALSSTERITNRATDIPWNLSDGEQASLNGWLTTGGKTWSSWAEDFFS